MTDAIGYPDTDEGYSSLQVIQIQGRRGNCEDDKYIFSEIYWGSLSD